MTSGNTQALGTRFVRCLEEKLMFCDCVQQFFAVRLSRNKLNSNNKPWKIFFTMSYSANVRTVHILKTGELIFSLEDFKKVQDRFSWVDKTFVLSEIFRLRPLTDANRFSFVAIYEETKRIKPLLNLEPEFYLSQLQWMHSNP